MDTHRNLEKAIQVLLSYIKPQQTSFVISEEPFSHATVIDNGEHSAYLRPQLCQNIKLLSLDPTLVCPARVQGKNVSPLCNYYAHLSLELTPPSYKYPVLNSSLPIPSYLRRGKSLSRSSCTHHHIYSNQKPGQFTSQNSFAETARCRCPLCYFRFFLD